MDKMMGIKTQPLDMNAACVWEKEGTGMQPRDFSEVEYNIRERFGLRSREDFDPKEGGGY